MSGLSARDALRYATEDSVVGLFLVIFGGWVVFALGGVAFGGHLLGLVSFIGLIVSAAGAFAMFAGIVATAYKVLVDSRSA
ncbi:hypothetical protein E6P09_09950 [Haloferax mediterranei ATCC 33500]|uniref:Cox cluster protein n=1 Tax=Haloferax mediterranei (strain ATCC 33500 / DSM 1411 / JCM 8866 / NBRC 14739 / NCIMB 2177 / R-4) TaxID=523841 RepID=M0J500_HALMT|nr:hypothetical protein [Haloferax mediterranei]AHZ21545.1 hypothetical protein BM92_02250 [Haloferax mediterranei ATCC 33500]EMA04006.1 hypothetical protein C439_03573 [Haloferax mediterranei ATCC 33500]MDX5989187.1 hypothetical protein [Haloferax mediterranei ATCC 33500]QCQ75568.1 hypothetical protein E6P09_09950 [Haloferax mediterranei ATCC 33500]